MRFAVAFSIAVLLNHQVFADRTAPIKLDPKDPCATLELPDPDTHATLGSPGNLYSQAHRKFGDLWKGKAERTKELAKAACLEGSGRAITAGLAVSTLEVKGLLADPYHRYYYTAYLPSGFLGGFGYADERVTELGAYSLYPQVNWLFAEDAPEYHKAVYGKEDFEKQAVAKFAYVGGFFPSTALVQAAADSSTLGVAARENFRSGVSYLASELIARLKKNPEKTGLQAYEIVVTRYESLGTDALVLEGFTAGQPTLSFKTYIDLVDEDEDMVFVPTKQAASKEELKHLAVLNAQITSAGGDPLRLLKKPVRSPTAPVLPFR